MSGPSEKRLVQRWDAWVMEMEDHFLDQFEYLGALQAREELEQWVQTTGDQVAVNEVEAIDHRFATLTMDDDRFAGHFPGQAGGGWWWRRLPSDPAAMDYLTRDWLT